MGKVGSCCVARAGVLEIEHDLSIVVYEDRTGIGRAIAVRIEHLADPAVAEIVGVLDHLTGSSGRIGRVVGEIADLDQPIAMVPGVARNVGIACSQRAALVRVDEAERSVPFCIVLVAIRAVGEELIVGAGHVSCAIGGNAVPVLVVDVILVVLPIARIVATGKLAGCIVVVGGVTCIAHQGGEIEAGQLTGQIIGEVIVGEDGVALQVREIGQATCLIEHVVGMGDEIGARQVGIAVERLGASDEIEQEVDVFLRYGVPAGLALLADCGNQPDIVVRRPRLRSRPRRRS